MCLVAQSCPALCGPMDCTPCQASLSVEFSRQEYWSEWLCPPPGDLPNPGIESIIAGGFFTSWATREAQEYWSEGGVCVCVCGFCCCWVTQACLFVTPCVTRQSLIWDAEVRYVCVSCSVRGSFWPRNWTGVSCIAGRFLTSWATREALLGKIQFHESCLIYNNLVLYSSQRWLHHICLENRLETSEKNCLQKPVQLRVGAEGQCGCEKLHFSAINWREDLVAILRVVFKQMEVMLLDGVLFFSSQDVSCSSHIKQSGVKRGFKPT